MVDLPVFQSQNSTKSSILVRIVTASISGGISTYILNYFSLKGVDFKTLGIDSEMVKAGIDGTIVGVVSAPDNLVYTLRDGILWIRFACKTLWDAIRYGKE